MAKGICEVSTREALGIGQLVLKTRESNDETLSTENTMSRQGKGPSDAAIAKAQRVSTRSNDSKYRLDRNEREGPPLLQAALAYAAQGLPVFPCKNRPGCDDNKAPHIKHGFLDATTDPEIIERWWCRWPDALIGIPTGEVFAVLDLDKKKGKNGFLHVPDWKRRSPVIALTQSGGAHLYFDAQGAPGCSTSQIALGVDTKGAGGYVIVPPSPGYTWLTGSDLSKLPPWPDDLRPPRYCAPRDPNAAPNQNARAHPKLVAAALKVIPNDDVGWDEWKKIGLATWAATNGSDEGFEAFDGWSSKSGKYDARTTLKAWHQIDRSPPDQIGAGSLFYLARKANPEWRDAFDEEVEAVFLARLRGRPCKK
jgi:hypothetical protein